MNKIAIHCVPRSGSTWLGQVFNSSPTVKYAYQPLFSYEFKSFLDDTSSKETISSFFEGIEKSNDSFINQSEDIKKNLVPNFETSEKIEAVVYKEVRYHYILENLLQKTDDLKVIGLIRNPLSVINSWLNAPNEFRKNLGWKEMEEWNFAEKKNQNRREEYNGFQKWKETTLLFEDLQEQYPERFYIIEYKDLIKDTNETIKQIFDFCDIELTAQTLSFINPKKTHNDENAYSVFKTIDKDIKWKSELNKEIVNSIKADLKHSVLEKYIQDEF